MVELEALFQACPVLLLLSSCWVLLRAKPWAACGWDLATTTTLVRKVLNNKYTFPHFTVII